MSEKHPGRYHATPEGGCWYVASPSGQTIVAGPFDSEAKAGEYADGLNKHRATESFAIALHSDGTSTDMNAPYCRDCGSNDIQQPHTEGKE